MKMRAFISIIALLLILSLGACTPKATNTNLIDNLHEQITYLTSQVATLQGQTIQLEKQVADLKIERDNALNDVAYLQTKQKDLEIEIDKLTSAEVPQLELSYFPSSSELSSWLDRNKDLQTTEYASIDEDYSQARELQKRAIQDGYILSVYVYDDGNDSYWVFCDAYMVTGDVYYWTMLDFDAVDWYGNWK